LKQIAAVLGLDLFDTVDDLPCVNVRIAQGKQLLLFISQLNKLQANLPKGRYLGIEDELFLLGQTFNMNPFKAVLLDQRAEQFDLLVLDEFDFIEKLGVAAADFFVADWLGRKGTQIGGVIGLWNEVPIGNVNDSVSRLVG